jgi:hypothetical protein
MNDNSYYRELLRALLNRLDVVADRELYQRDPAGHLAALRSAAEELDKLLKQLPGDAPPTLRHYLERQSYVKAVEFLRENSCAF